MGMSDPGCARSSQESQPPIHVAHLIHTMAYGGIETALLNWLRTMNAERFRVSLYCFSNPGATEQPFIDAANALGIAVRTIPWNRSKPVLRSVRRLSQLMREDGITILHCHNAYADLVGLLAAKMTRAKSVTTLYVWGNFGFVRNAIQTMDRLLLPFFDQVTVHCEETWRGTVERGFPEDRLRLLPCGFEVSPLTITSEERVEKRHLLGAGQADFVLIHVARFWPEKAHDVLLESFRLVIAEHPEALLWMLGVGPQLEPVKALASKLGLLDKVVFLGFRTDLAELLLLADLQVHPSDMEGVPLAICQGMAQGLPIVATDVGGLAEVLKHNVSGLLIERRNAAQCSGAILQLMNDPPLRKRLGAEAARFIAEEYSLAAATCQVEQVYLDLTVRG
jgi:glycosyltransferase involved in cell wall biosynthesis